MAKRSTFSYLEEIAEKMSPKKQAPPFDPVGYQKYLERYGKNIGTDLPEISGYDFPSVFRAGVKPKNWLDLPEDAQYEDVAQALSGIHRFPQEETEFLRQLSPYLYPKVFDIFKTYMQTRPPMYYWPDVGKIRREE